MNIAKQFGLNNTNKLLKLPLNDQLKLGKPNKNNILKSWIKYILPIPAKPLKIWGLNVRSFQQTNKQQQMYEKLKQEKPDIVLLNETWLKKDSLKNNFFVNNDDFLLLSSNMDQNYQGTAILVKKKIQAISAKQIIHPSKNLSEIIIKTDPENTISFLSVYVPPDGDAERDAQRLEAKQLMYNFFEYKNQKKKFLAYSDINTKLRSCDTPNQKKEVEEILQNFKKNKVELLYSKNVNDFTRPSNNNPKEGNYIDFFFQRGLNYSNHKIKPSPVESDHLLLEMYVNRKTPKKTFFYTLLFLGLFYKYCSENDLQQIFHQIPYNQDTKSPYIQKLENEPHPNLQKKKLQQKQNQKQENAQQKLEKIINKKDTNTNKVVNIKQQTQEKKQEKVPIPPSKAMEYYYFVGYMYLAFKVMFNQEYIKELSKQIVNVIYGFFR